ncbi:MAG: hypothetical protein NC548_06270 [Lachnospiraceae bacterium]|nr:hypothetical protein [Lachnospiraceae bacterium]
MINPAIVSDRVSAKLNKLSLDCIVTEAVIRALPFTSAEVAKNTSQYAQYVSTVTECLGGYNMMTTAMENYREDEKAMKLLKLINAPIISTVQNATARIVREAASNPTATVQEIEDAAGFTKEEMADFARKGQDLSVPEISEIIKDKVVTTITAEKEAYENNKRLEEDISETLKDQLGDEAPSLESYYNIVLEKKDPRKPISFFSRMQDVCIESLLQTCSTTDLGSEEISMESFNLAIANSLKCFDTTKLPLNSHLNTMLSALESFNYPEDEMQSRIQRCGKKSLIMNIIIMTIMETLKTLRLFDPDMDTIRDFIDNPTNAGNYNGIDVANKVHAQIDGYKKLMRNPEFNAAELSAAMDECNTIKSKLNAIKESVLPEKEDLMKALTDTHAAIEQCLAKNGTTATEGITSAWATRCRENNIAEFDRARRILMRNRDTSKIEVRCSSTMATEATNTIEVVAKNAAGAILDSISASIAMQPEFGTVLEEVKTAAGFSKLSDIASQCELYYTDKCYAVPLMD